jgi:hypothetical protein
MGKCGARFGVLTERHHVDRDSLDTQLSDRERADLAAFADGTLPERRRAAVEARLATSPELTALVDEQRRARDTVRTAAAEVAAPASLRARLEAARKEAAPKVRRRKFILGGTFAAAAAAVALALVLTPPGDVPGGPTTVEAAELSAQPATAPPPPRDPLHPRLLAEDVEGVPYPWWGGPRLQWKTTGTRTDELDGRTFTTVFYERAGKRVGYQIVPGKRIAPPVATDQETVDGVVYRSFTANGRNIVTWVRDDHTCVLSGRGVPYEVLRKLAAWPTEA